jgi:nucleoside-diphosphate-sugar epimerase
VTRNRRTAARPDPRRRAKAAATGPAASSAESPPGTVAVTGAAGVLGDLVVTALAGDIRRAQVVAIDATATANPGTVPVVAHGGSGPPMQPVVPIAWRTADVRDPLFDRVLDGVDVVVHATSDQRPDVAAADRRALNVHGTRTLLAAATAAGVRRVVVVSSAMVYGALPDNPPALTEDMPLRAAYDDSVVGDYVEVERMIAEHVRRHPELAISVLRPVTVVGPGSDTVLTRHFEAPRLLTVRDFEPRWQFCHVRDLAAACALAVDGGLDGPVNVSPPGSITQADVERISGLRRLELPSALVFGAAERLHRAGVTLAPAAELAYIAYPWQIDPSRLLAAGWLPGYDHESALRAQLVVARDHTALAARRVGREDATRAAAGATVAALGAAAIIRRARRRRG